MQPPSNPLVEAAVRPLRENSEQRLAAIAVLSENTDPNHPLAAETIERWEKQDRKKWPWFPKALVYGAAIIALVWVFFYQFQEMRLFRSFSSPSLFEPPKILLPEGLDEKGKLLLGDPQLGTFEQAAALYHSEPDNPAYFAQYVCAYISDYSALPDGYFETAARIDPENSFFLYLAAGTMDSDVIEWDRSSTTSSPNRFIDGVRLSPLPVERQTIINDRTTYENSLNLLEKAAALPTFNNYGIDLMVERLRLVDSAEKISENSAGLMIIFSSSSHGIFAIYKVADVISARAQELSAAGDAEGFRRLVMIREHLLAALGKASEGMVVEELIFQAVAQTTAQYLGYAARDLGSEDLEGYYGSQTDAIQKLRDDRKLLYAKKDESMIRECGSVFAGLVIGMLESNVLNPSPLTPEQLAPGRYADHAFAMRAGITAIIFLFLVVSIPVFLFRFVFQKALWMTGTRFVTLLRASDWMLAFFLGMVAPAAVILILNRFTPLGGREWSVTHFVLLFPGVHLVVMALWMLLAPAMIIRWRLLRRSVAFGLPLRPPYLSVLALIGVTAVALAAYPLVTWIGDSWILMALAAPGVFWLAIVLWNALHGIIGNARQRLSLAATSTAVLPLYAAAIIALPVLLPIYEASEIHWLAQDTLLKPDVSAPDYGLYEFRVAVQMRKEMREVLSMEN